MAKKIKKMSKWDWAEYMGGLGFLEVKVLKSNSLKSFSDEAYGFITCGAEPPHKVNVNVKGGGVSVF
jgi:hypothetical protein